MARKKSKDEINVDDPSLDENGEEKGGFTSILIALVIIAIWLVIFGLLIKMDVGGVGSMLRPFLKNVPVINQILPEVSDDEIAEQTGYKYKNLAEAVERIKELENELANYQNSGNASAEQIAQLQAEVDRLKVFEENQQYYQQLKEEFDREVVFAENAPDIEEYKKFYEAIEPENAEKLYKEVLERIQYSQKIKDLAEVYAKMDAANAAAIFEEMTGDTDIVTDILLSMATNKRSAILAEMDTVYAAKLTKLMYP